MDSVDKPRNTMIVRENTLNLRVEDTCQVSMSRQKGRERLRVTIAFHAAGRVEPNEGRGLGVNNIAIRTIDII